jgi:hypothetical protein
VSLLRNTSDHVPLLVSASSRARELDLPVRALVGLLVRTAPLLSRCGIVCRTVHAGMQPHASPVLSNGLGLRLRSGLEIGALVETGYRPSWCRASVPVAQSGLEPYL